MTSVLVTGANGFLGRHVLARIGGARRTYGLVRDLPAQPLPGGAEPLVRDLRGPTGFDLPDSPATIVHLAQSPRYRDFPEGALDVFDVNVGSTQRLLDWALAHRVRRFVYASSGGVYGHGDAAFDEDSPVGCQGTIPHYLASKRCGELIAEAYSDRLVVVILRFFFVYGPGQRRTMLTPRLIDSVLQGRPILLQGEDGFRLNPVYVEDAAAAVEAAIGLEESATINVAGPEPVTLRRFSLLIGQAAGCRPGFEIQPEAAPRHLVGDTDKMSRLLVAPRISPAEGMRRIMSATRARQAGGFL